MDNNIQYYEDGWSEKAENVQSILTESRLLMSETFDTLRSLMNFSEKFYSDKQYELAKERLRTVEQRFVANEKWLTDLLLVVYKFVKQYTKMY